MYFAFYYTLKYSKIGPGPVCAQFWKLGAWGRVWVVFWYCLLFHFTFQACLPFTEWKNVVYFSFYYTLKYSKIEPGPIWAQFWNLEGWGRVWVVFWYCLLFHFTFQACCMGTADFQCLSYGVATFFGLGRRFIRGAALFLLLRYGATTYFWVCNVRVSYGAIHYFCCYWYGATTYFWFCNVRGDNLFSILYIRGYNIF